MVTGAYCDPKSRFPFASSGGMIYAGTGEGSMQEHDELKPQNEGAASRTPTASAGLGRPLPAGGTSRREFLKTSLAGTVILDSAAFLTGCSV